MNFLGSMLCAMFYHKKEGDRRLKLLLTKLTHAGPGIDMAKSNREDLSPLNIVLAHRQGKR